MDRLKRLIRLGLAVLAAAQLAACSKTVQWEEEVPLNTGETIWVKREVTYKYKGAGGNPLDMAYRPDWTEEIAFEWKGRKYRYVGDAQVMLLAISPTIQQPVLVAMKSIYGQGRSMEQWCVKPFYEQLVVNEDRWEWKILPRIEPWTFNLPRNLMAHRSARLEDVNKSYSSADRLLKDANMMRDNPPSAYIDPNYQPEFCVRR